MEHNDWLQYFNVQSQYLISSFSSSQQRPKNVENLLYFYLNYCYYYSLMKLLEYHSYRLRNRSQLGIPYYRLMMKKKWFQAIALSMYNDRLRL